MIRFPNCKINLGLHILRKRDDGFHDLETVFYPVALRDALEIIRDPIADDHSSSNGQEHPQETSSVSSTPLPLLTSSGLIIDGDDQQNLVLKAYRLLQKDFPQLHGVKFHLHKHIPMGAGLGGGSADGSFALMMLNDLFALGLSEKKLIDYAAQLGSDCAFFVLNRPCFATGRGESLESIQLDLSSYSFILVHPNIHISTATAFSKISPRVPEKSIKEIIQQPVETWKTELKNDFEPGLFVLHPELDYIKTALYDAGAIYSSMSGSGSSIYALFPKGQLPSLHFSEQYQVATIP